MGVGAAFDSTKNPLQDLLKAIGEGRIQLPDFQRGWVWDDYRIRSLLASISVAFPIGAVMTMETGGETRFRPRLVEGVGLRVGSVHPDTLILDGQQRLTSLYQALMGHRPVVTKDSKNKVIARWYYIDMIAALADSSDWEDAIVSVPEDRLVKTFGREIALDLSSPEKEYAAHHFPVNCVFDSTDWRQGYYKYWKYDGDRIRQFDQFEVQVIKRFEQYQVPVIRLTKETPKEAVCLVFEKVNTGGVPLNVFELLTASFAAEDFQLRDDWTDRERRLKNVHPVLRGLQNDDFLQIIALLVTQSRRRDCIAYGECDDRLPAIGCKRRDILRLTVDEYRTWAQPAEEGLVRAARFLHCQKIFKAGDVPYRTQLVPLAAILADLGASADTEGAKRKIARWYWCGVLGELYGGTLEYRFARDLPEVVSMVRGGEEPSTVKEAHFSANRLLTLRTRNSAAYKGIYALLMRDGCRDFRTGDPIEAHGFFDDEIDIHHIFPQAWCRAKQVDSLYADSVINKTAISARTNRRIGGQAPSAYLRVIEREADVNDEILDSILLSHRIRPAALRADDFWAMFSARAEALLDLIEGAMEKPLARDVDFIRKDQTAEEYDDEPVNWDDQPVCQMDVGR